VILAAVGLLACGEAFSVPALRRPSLRAAAINTPRRCPAVRADEYSNRVRVTAETRAPLQQARLFFLYPATLAGAAIGAYVSLTRLAAGLSGMRTDLEPSADGLNLLVNIGVVAAAVYFGMGDLKSRDELLKSVAIELGELKAEARAATESSAPEAPEASETQAN